ncbi:YdcF family protein [Rhodocaloribacter sp.]
MFFVKKILSDLLMPAPVVLGLLIVGLVLVWRGKRLRAGRTAVALGAALLFVLTVWPVPHLGIRLLERQYPPFDPALSDSLAWIVVLGGGVADDASLPPNDQLGRASLARLVEGVRLARWFPEARLLVSGWGGLGTRTEAAAMRDVAVTLGVAPARITLDEASRDTHDQAVRTRALVGDAPFALVTSAYHMPRAMALFRKQGLAPVPAPTDHQYKARSRFDVRLLIPNGSRLALARTALHEYFGLVWSQLRGQL